MLTELHTYVSEIPRPHPLSVSETECTLKFLEACNLVFEKGFLSHEIVSVRNNQVLANIEKGYDFFCKWLEGVYKEGIGTKT